MKFKIISCYKYIEVENPENLRLEISSLCRKLDITGRILIGKEGLNAAVSGSPKNIETFKSKIKENPLFSDMTFREQFFREKTYKKLTVKVRNEIVNFGKPVDLSKTGEHVKPEVLKEWLDKKEDLVLLEGRNQYEAKVGKFKNALVLPIKNFRQFPDAVSKLSHLKSKKIVMYCTGGIRCEKASAYLKQEGFENVHQLEGGIINYINKFPNDHFEGSCFVFDERIAAETENPITECEICGKKSYFYINCNNLDCDKLFVSCKPCQKKMQKTCSQKCFDSPRKRPEKREVKIIGTVENYYPKAKVALVKLNKKIKIGQKIKFCGKTTKEFEQRIKEMKDCEGNKIESARGLITFPVSEKVRVNDKVFV